MVIIEILLSSTKNSIHYTNTHAHMHARRKHTNKHTYTHTYTHIHARTPICAHSIMQIREHGAPVAILFWTTCCVNMFIDTCIEDTTTTRDVRWDGSISQVDKHYNVREQCLCFQRCLVSLRCFAAMYMPQFYACLTTTDTTHRTVHMSTRHPGMYVYYRVNRRCPGT